MRAMPSQTGAETAIPRPLLSKPVKGRYSSLRFPDALKSLMEERHLSYRQLAYKTKLSAGYLNHLTKGSRPVPADVVIRALAAALHVEADFFLEYRLRRVASVLDSSPPLADKLYGILVCEAPVTEELIPLLEHPRNGDSPSVERGVVGL